MKIYKCKMNKFNSLNNHLMMIKYKINSIKKAHLHKIKKKIFKNNPKKN